MSAAVQHTGGRVARVGNDSPAERAGVRPGDLIVAADGFELRDVIDWRWHSGGGVVSVTIESAGAVRDVELRRSQGGWGLDFESSVFDGIRECSNACEFCFVGQLPAGLRPSLYVRDDDFRLSFLLGNFITLTNLSDADVARILEQRLSPLYVSLHAVDPAVRERLIRCSAEDTAVDILRDLDGGGIDTHVQIVLVPGVNDGTVLEETLDWLEGLSRVISVGVVPLGFTAHQSRYRRTYDESSARRVVDAVDARRHRRLDEGRDRWVHAADEFYLTAGLALPRGDEYEGYPQYENGIGLVRSFMDGWTEGPRLGQLDPGQEVVLCSGEAFSPVLSSVVHEAVPEAAVASVLSVKNSFFGGGVNVTGLLTGVDLATSIREDARRPSVSTRRYLVPRVVLNDEGYTLDGLSAAAVVDAAGADVRFVPTDAHIFRERLTDIWNEE